MHRFAALVVLLIGCSSIALAAPRVARVSICEILQNPGRFDGKWVQVTGDITHNPEFTALTDPSGCGGMVYVFPGSSELSVRPARFALVKDGVYKRFDSLVSARRKADLTGDYALLSPTYLYNVTATFVGRLDSPKDSPGFGHLNQFKARLVVRRVLKVSATPVRE